MRQLLVEKVLFPLWELKHSGTRLSQLKALRESQWWPAERLANYQERRLKTLYARAVQTVPYYSSLVREGRLPAQITGLDALPSLPLLSKSDVRRLGDRLLSSDIKQSQLKSAKTGGSTGTSLTLYFDKQCEEWRNAAEARSGEWAGKAIGEPFFALWGNMGKPETLGEWFRDRVLNGVIYVDTMAINDGIVEGFVEAWRRSPARSIYGHAHSIYIIAARLKRMGVRDIRPRSIISTSMTLLDAERRIIEEVFHCKATNRYGCEEVGLIAAECEAHSGLHVNAEHVIVEVLRADGSAALDGEEGDVVVTDLNNFGMPLIRYRIEDRSSWIAERCKCGRSSARLRSIAGRVADFLKKADGTLVAGVSLVERTLTAFPEIEQLQIVQSVMDRFEMRVVPGLGYTEDVARNLVGEMTKIFGAEIEVAVVTRTALERTGREKFRFAICRV